MLGEEIVEIMEEEDFDIEETDKEELEDLQSRFEDDMEEFISEYIRDHKSEIAYEYASRLGLRKKNGMKPNSNQATRDIFDKFGFEFKNKR